MVYSTRIALLALTGGSFDYGADVMGTDPLRTTSHGEVRSEAALIAGEFSMGAAENDKKHDDLCVGSTGIRPHG